MDSNEQPNGAVLFAKMARIMGKIKRLPKSGHNQHFNYKFATESDIADTIRELMAEENIALFAEMVNINPNGKKTHAQFIFTFACGDTGYTRSCSWFGEADDSQDKGVSKSATSAEKFFLLKTFVMSTGDERDDPDSDSDLDGKAQGKSQGRGNQQRQQTRNGNGNPPAVSGGGAKAFPNVAAKEAFVKHWDATDGLNEEQLKMILGVKFFNEYTGTLAEANAAVENRNRAAFGAKAKAS